MRADDPRTTCNGERADKGEGEEAAERARPTAAGLSSAPATRAATTTTLTFRTESHFAEVSLRTCSHHPAWPTTQPPTSRPARATLAWPGVRPVRTTSWARLAGCQPMASRRVAW